MNKYIRKKGFTLIELLIVIAIIAILATIAVFSYVNAQTKARDNKRKADVQSIASAYQIHYQESKTWKFSGAELQKLVPPPDVSVTGEGSGGGGNGYFNYEGGTYYVSMAHALSGLGYLNPAPRDPQITGDNVTVNSSNGARQYMKYYHSSCGGIVVYAKLESPSSNEGSYIDSKISDACKTSVQGIYDAYLMNYSVGVK